MNTEIQHYMQQLGQTARTASRAMARADTDMKNTALRQMAVLIEQQADQLKAENAKDIEQAHAKGLDSAFIDRLTLSDKAIKTMIDGLRQIAELPDPIGQMSGFKTLPSGITVGQMRVPLGVIGIIYESRPNVTIDAAALCIKSGNATILRGGSEALHSNQALAKIVQAGLAHAGLPESAVQVVNTPDRAAVGADAQRNFAELLGRHQGVVDLHRGADRRRWRQFPHPRGAAGARAPQVRRLPGPSRGVPHARGQGRHAALRCLREVVER